MRILHTADWHLGDRLGRIDRTADLQKAVERVAAACESEKADVLLVAGDLFSELCRPDGLRDTIAHLREVFTPFLLNGGTILALTGNHDNETFCQTLRLAMQLASPAVTQIKTAPVPPKRLYLAAGPTMLRLADADGHVVQFILMPYPTPQRYLLAEAQNYGSLEEKNRALQGAYTSKLQSILAGQGYDPTLPTVLSAHVHVQGGVAPNLFRMTERESIIFAGADVPAGLAYVALGHIHKAQSPIGEEHVRYSGSIEKLDLGEKHDDKGMVLFEVGRGGRVGELVHLPLPSTPMYDVEITNPSEEIPRLRERYPDHETALVRFKLQWTAGVDNREALLSELEDVFPRWYEREVREANALGLPLSDPAGAAPQMSFAETVRGYVQTELMNHTDEEQAAVFAMLEALLDENAGPG